MGNIFFERHFQAADSRFPEQQSVLNTIGLPNTGSAPLKTDIYLMHVCPTERASVSTQGFLLKCPTCAKYLGVFLSS